LKCEKGEVGKQRAVVMFETHKRITINKLREFSVNVLVFTYNEVGIGQKVITLKLGFDKERNKQMTIKQNNVL
jgi:hypothetical protein